VNPIFLLRALAAQKMLRQQRTLLGRAAVETAIQKVL